MLPNLVTAWLAPSTAAAVPYQISLWLAPVFYLGGFLAVVGMRPVPPSAHQATAAARGHAPVAFLAAYVLLFFLLAAAEGSLRAFFNVYLDNRLALQVGQIGGIMGVSQLLPVVAALAAPLVMARLGTIRTIWVTSVGAAAGLALAALIPHWGAAATGFMVLSATITVGSTARGVFGMEAVPVEWRTTSSAMATVGLALGWALMAVAGGVVIAQMGYRPLFMAGAGLAVSAAALTVALWSRTPVQKPVAAEPGI
jgi:predicted MFS family arabinose efflux permease